MNTKKWNLFIPISLDRAWAFFSRPENLKLITTPALNLSLTSSLTDMYEGMMIHYTVTPYCISRSNGLAKSPTSKIKFILLMNSVPAHTISGTTNIILSN